MELRLKPETESRPNELAAVISQGWGLRGLRIFDLAVDFGGAPPL